MIFYVLELQTGDTAACLPIAFDNRPDAEAKYHEILQYAAKSTIKKHGAMIVNEDGFVCKHEMYVKGTEPEPEPEPNA